MCDCETFNIMLNVKGQGKDTLGRTRSTGRPKKSSKRIAAIAMRHLTPTTKSLTKN
jgi:hypothetical protein